MKPCIIANYIVKFENELEANLFEASLASVRNFCDRIAVVWAPSGLPLQLPPKLAALMDTYKVEHFTSQMGKVQSFSDIRNKALEFVGEGEFFYWIDADEVGFPEHLAKLKSQLARRMEVEEVTQVRTRFTHFCLNPHWYERMEPRNTIIRKGPTTRWEGAVHERIVGIPQGTILHSDYTLHHYGYCKPQADVFQHWQHYAELEGDPNRYVNEEVDGKCLPYFRPEDRPSSANILDDRKKVLLPYTGEYPSEKLLAYLEKVCPHV